MKHVTGQPRPAYPVRQNVPTYNSYTEFKEVKNVGGFIKKLQLISYSRQHNIYYH